MFPSETGETGCKGTLQMFHTGWGAKTQYLPCAEVPCSVFSLLWSGRLSRYKGNISPSLRIKPAGQSQKNVSPPSHHLPRSPSPPCSPQSATGARVCGNEKSLATFCLCASWWVPWLASCHQPTPTKMSSSLKACQRNTQTHPSSATAPEPTGIWHLWHLPVTLVRSFSKIHVFVLIEKHYYYYYKNIIQKIKTNKKPCAMTRLPALLQCLWESFLMR